MGKKEKGHKRALLAMRKKVDKHPNTRPTRPLTVRRWLPRGK